MNEILTSKELAKLLKVTRNTINNWRKKGMPFLKGETSVRFDKDKVEEWLKVGK